MHQTSNTRPTGTTGNRSFPLLFSSLLFSPLTFPVPLVRADVSLFEVVASDLRPPAPSPSSSASASSSGAGATFFPRPLLRPQPPPPPPPPDEDDAEARLPPARERLRPAAVAALAAASSSSAPPSWYWAALDRSPWIGWSGGPTGEPGGTSESFHGLRDDQVNAGHACGIMLYVARANHVRYHTWVVSGVLER